MLVRALQVAHVMQASQPLRQLSTKSLRVNDPPSMPLHKLPARFRLSCRTRQGQTPCCLALQMATEQVFPPDAQCRGDQE